MISTINGNPTSCSINGTTVVTHARSDVVAAGKLKSTDGIYGIRFAHNTDAIDIDFKKTKVQ